MQAIHFQLLHAPPFVINFSGDLKYGTLQNENLHMFFGLTCGMQMKLMICSNTF